jgi:phage antirepressor YoqD-like protein
MKEKSTEPKYGVKDAAKALGLKEATVRMSFRKHGIKRAGKSYGWATQADMNADLKKLEKA